MSVDIEDIFPLSAVQRVWLLHALQARRRDVGVTHSQCVLSGELDTGAFRASWQSVVDHHPALRTSFHWQDLDHPVQVVHRSAPLQIEQIDGRDLDRPDLEEKIQEILEADRQTGFELEKAPLMRLILVRTGGVEYRLIWSLHHLMMDGWSAQVVFTEAMENYEATRSDRAIVRPAAPSYHRYVEWEDEQELDGAEKYWRGLLAGATPLSLALQAGHLEPVDRSETLAVDDDATAGIAEFCRRARVTPSILLQGVLGLLLATWARREEVVLGLTAAGRPEEIPETAEAVGLFINTIPTRVSIVQEQPVSEWLRDLQHRYLASVPFHYCPAEMIQSWSDDAGQRLFETVLVVENQKGGDVGGALLTSGLEVGDFDGEIVSGYPLNVVAILEPRIEIQLHYKSKCFPRESILWLLQAMGEVLGRVGRDDEPRVADLQTVIADPPAVETRPGQPSRTAPARRVPLAARSGDDIESASRLGESLDRDLARAMAAIWCEYLGIEQVDDHDNFFELGGTSLTAAQLLERLGSEHGITVDISDLVFQTFAQVVGSSRRDLQSDHLAAGSKLAAEQPLYFSGAGGRLFGVLHRPVAEVKSIGMVFCPPFGYEYVQSHRSYRQLAQMMSKSGLGVLRFDLTGCGDSEGSMEAGSLELWVEDAAAAAEELRRRLDCTQVGFFGARLGGMVAMRAARSGDRVALWDPVVSGAAYLDELAAEVQGAVGRAHLLGPVDGRDEVLGFPLTPRLRGELQGANLLLATLGTPMDVLILEDDVRRSQELAAKMRASGVSVTHEHAPASLDWRWAEDIGGAAVPQGSLRRIVEWMATS